MKSQKLVRVEVDGEITHIILDSAAKHNCLTPVMTIQLHEAFENIDTRVVVLSAEGVAFSAGSDPDYIREILANTEHQNITDSARFQDLMRNVAHCSQPVITLVHGNVFGSLLGVVAASDFVIATEDAAFSFAQVKMGLIPGNIAPYVFQRTGFAKARRLFLTGEVFDADSAEILGLVDYVCKSKKEADKTVKWLVAELLRGSPHAQSEIKRLTRRAARGESQNLPEITATVRASEQAQEGMRAFLEKRKPDWK
ncbi:MAG: enoyl-CoA hydratase-related protein [Turneriella sp.]